MGERELTLNTRPHSGSLAAIPSNDSTDATPSVQESGSDEPHVIRYYKSTLDCIRSLPEDDILVLFTPVIPPPPLPHSSTSNGENRNIDPFEHLGRAMSKHHAKVRHVPYLPAIGMTDTHTTFSQHAGATIVVVCDVSNLCRETKGIEYANQMDFARAVLSDAMVDAEDNGIQQPPMVGVLITEDVEKRERDWASWTSLLQCSTYTPGALAKVGDLVFSG